MLEEVLAKIDGLTVGESSVSKNIIESDASSFNRKNKVNARLTSSEKQRLINQTTIFWETYYKIRSKFEKDTKAETRVATPAASAASAASKTAEQEAKKSKKGILGTILALAGLLRTFGGSILKFLGKMLLRALKGLGKLIVKALKGIWKVIKPLLIKAWQAFKKAAMRIFKGVKRLITRAIRGVGKLMRKAFTGLMKSKPIQAAKKLIGEGVEKVKNFFTKIKNFFINKIKAVGSFFKNIFSKIPGIGKLFPSLAKPVPKPGAVKPTPAAKPKPSLLGRVWGGIKSGAKAVGGGIKAAGGAVVKGAKAVGGAVVKGAKAVGSAAKAGAVKVLRAGTAKIIGSGSRGVIAFLRGAGSRLPILGPAIESLFTAYDIKNLKEKYEKGELSLEELQQQAGRRSIQGLTALLGAGAGAFIGGGLGTIIPGPGNIIGMIAGGFLGDIAGRVLGGLLSDYIIPKKYTKSIGSFFTGTPAPQNEMQDFIMQNGKVMPFSNKDQVLGMKTGGAIDQLFNSVKGVGSGIMSSIGKIDTSKLTTGLSGAASGIGAMFSNLGSGLSNLAGGGLKEEVHKSNFYLKQLVELTVQSNKLMAGKKGSAVAVSSGGKTEIPTSFSDSRSDYFNSPYSINVPGIGQ